MSIEVSIARSERIIRDYLCANCWGKLFTHPTNKKTKNGSTVVQIHCFTDGCDCKGFVSKSWKERKAAAGRIERSEVYRHLADHLDWVRERGPDRRYEDRWDADKKRVVIEGTTEEKLKDLGF